MARKKAYTDALYKQVGLFVKENNHLNKYEVADLFGVDPKLIWKIAHACGVKLAFAPRTKPNDKLLQYETFIRENSHLTVKEIAKELNESTRYVFHLVYTRNLIVKRERPYKRRIVENVESEFLTIKAGENWLI